MSDDATSAMRQRLMTAEDVYVYKIPPMKNSGGHRAEDWNLSEPLKTCNLLVERRGDTLVLEFQHDGGIFAQSLLDVTKGGKVAQFLEQVVDSSRYFVVKIQGGGGREALIGFGFRDREKATDLRESLDHYEKSIKREAEAESKVGSYHVPKLGEGEKIHVNKSGKSTVVKKEKSGSGAVPLLGKKPPPPAAEDSQDPIAKISIAIDGIDLDAPSGDGDGSNDDESGGAVFEGDEDEWKTEFDMK
ncbi:hypothetical protein ACA910_014577 [Epithemia clementina (nom. ined.)]